MSKKKMLLFILVLLLLTIPIKIMLDNKDNNDTLKTQFSVLDSNGNILSSGSSDEYISLEDPKKTGYTFVDWYTDSNFETPFDGYIEKDTVLYPKFEKNKYSITFDLAGEDLGDDKTLDVLYNESFTKPSDPVKEGYKFIGWFTCLDCDTPYNFDSLVTENINLIARFEKINNNIYVYNKPVVTTPVTTTTYYTVTFDTGVISKVAKNNKVPMPTEPIKDGYEFIGWYLDNEFTEKFNFNTLITENLNIYARFIKNGAIKLTYKTTDNSFNEIVALDEQAIPSSLINTTSLDNSQESIIGWYKDEDMTEKFDFSSEVKQDTTIYVKTAAWTDSSYFERENNTITGYKEEGPKDVVIPKYIDGVLITDIGNFSLQSLSLTSVSIPSSIKRIGESSLCYNEIKEVILPDSIEFLGIFAFSFNKIENIVFSKSLQETGHFTFGYNKIKELSIPGTIETVGLGAFGYNEIEKLTISDDVKNIMGGAFNNNKLPDNEAFIYKRENGIEDKNNVASYAGIKREAIVMPNSITKLETLSFAMCEITSIKLSDNLEFIGESAFTDNKLTEIILPKNIKTIEDGAFGLNQITKIIIPENLENFGKKVFDVWDLKEIYMPGRTENPFGKDWFSGVTIKFEEPSN